MKLVLSVSLILAAFACATAHTEQRTNALEAKSLIPQLYEHAWEGAENSCNPMCWNFHFTEPMEGLLSIGPSAQDALLKKIDDPQIKDQIIILLGGIGDERVIGPIISAMVSHDEIANTPNAQKINLAANLALTNITVADVIWHHGGGIEIRRCPDNPKECWAEWWKKTQATFNIKDIKQSRNYTNYPNYGMYKDWR